MSDVMTTQDAQILASQPSNIEPTRPRSSGLEEHWASIPKVGDSIPTVARVTSQTSYSPEYITPTQKKSSNTIF